MIYYSQISYFGDFILLRSGFYAFVIISWLNVEANLRCALAKTDPASWWKTVSAISLTPFAADVIMFVQLSTIFWRFTAEQEVNDYKNIIFIFDGILCLQYYWLCQESYVLPSFQYSTCKYTKKDVFLSLFCFPLHTKWRGYITDIEDTQWSMREEKV